MPMNPIRCTIGTPSRGSWNVALGKHVPSRACVQHCALPTDEPVRNAKDVKVGFRWDPGMSRWIKDDKLQGQVNAPVVIQPKSGAAYTAWPVMWSDLMDFGLKSVSVPEAAELQKEGWTLVDVRLVDNFNYSHIEGSVSIPLYRPVQGDSVFDNIKRLAMASFAMKATERDPDFAQKVEQQVGKDAKVLLVCDIGGSLKTTHEVAHKKKDYEVRDPERAFGRESRSYKAAHALIEAGFTNLLHLDGGLQQWRHQGYPCQSAAS